MKRRLIMWIDAGEKTCASSTGNLCEHVRVTRMGMRWVCGMFHNTELFDETGGQKGWLRRLPQCLVAENEKPAAPPPAQDGEDRCGDFTSRLLEAKANGNLLEWRRCRDAIARAVRAGKLTPIEADALRNLAASTKAAIVAAEEAEYEASYYNDEPSEGPL